MSTLPYHDLTLPCDSLEFSLCDAFVLLSPYYRTLALKLDLAWLLKFLCAFGAKLTQSIA